MMTADKAEEWLRKRLLYNITSLDVAKKMKVSEQFVSDVETPGYAIQKSIDKYEKTLNRIIKYKSRGK